MQLSLYFLNCVHILAFTLSAGRNLTPAKAGSPFSLRLSQCQEALGRDSWLPVSMRRAASAQMRGSPAPPWPTRVPSSQSQFWPRAAPSALVLLPSPALGPGSGTPPLSAWKPVGILRLPQAHQPGPPRKHCRSLLLLPAQLRVHRGCSESLGLHLESENGHLLPWGLGPLKSVCGLCHFPPPPPGGSPARPDTGHLFRGPLLHRPASSAPITPGNGVELALSVGQTGSESGCVPRTRLSSALRSLALRRGGFRNYKGSVPCRCVTPAGGSVH